MTAYNSESEPLVAWTGRFAPDRWAPASGTVTVRTLREMHRLFKCDFQGAQQAGLSEETVIYRVWRLRGDEDQQIPEISVTSIEPGAVGDELFMTHGHRHQESKGETYMCLRGNGGILARAGSHIRWYAMREGDVVQLPGAWAHRTVNTGYRPFVFSGHYSAPFTVSYDEILSVGMGASVVHTSGNHYEVRSHNGTILAHGRRE
jgi:glucose-6-phosphate isomerase, archaeal